MEEKPKIKSGNPKTMEKVTNETPEKWIVTAGKFREIFKKGMK